jgi:hypothetical protein
VRFGPNTGAPERPMRHYLPSGVDAFRPRPRDLNPVVSATMNVENLGAHPVRKMCAKLTNSDYLSNL